ncbi:MAG: HAD family hydrolase [Bacteroidota bacterium]
MHLVIFDVDGTLTQTFYSGDNCFLKALSRFIEVEKDYPYWKECEHPTDEAVFHHMFRKITGDDPKEDDRSKMQDQFIVELMHKYRHTPGFFDEIPGAARFIKELRSEPDTIVGVATGGWEKVARFKLELAGIDVNDIELIGCDLHHDKPSFTQALIDKIAGSKTISRITYIGDSLYDYETTQKLGINFIGIDFLQRGHLNHLTFCPVYTDYREVRLG